MARPASPRSSRGGSAIGTGGSRGVSGGATVTDFTDEEPLAAMTVQDARERMQKLRADLVAAMRTETPADPKGTRKLVIGALSVLTPRAALLRKLAKCGRRNEVNDSREFCCHPACGVCMERRADWLFKERLWPALESVPASRLRWITVLMFVHRDLDDGVQEMKRQHRRLQHVLKKFAGGAGTSRRAVRVWGAREVEPSDDGWMFHTHLLVDLDGADPRRLGKMLRAAWGSGSRQVQIKVMQQREHRANITRLAHYMTKARYTRDAGDRREWLSNENIVTLALWRDRQPAQWHRFTFGVRGV
jgi:hypothetical protein